MFSLSEGKSNAWRTVVDIVLNIKAMAVKMQGDRPQRLYLRAVGPGEVTAGMIELPGDVSIMDPKHLICTLDDGASISMELMVATGKGYVPASANRPEDAPIGLIPVDSVFSPVKRVSYKIENSRVGQVTDYDRLSMTVETNGTTRPDDAVALAESDTALYEVSDYLRRVVEILGRSESKIGPSSCKLQFRHEACEIFFCSPGAYLCHPLFHLGDRCG